MHARMLLWYWTWLVFKAFRWFCTIGNFLLQENDFFAVLWTKDIILGLIFIWFTLTLDTNLSTPRASKFTKIIGTTIQIIVYALWNSSVRRVYTYSLSQVRFIAFFHWLNVMAIVANRINSLLYLQELRWVYFRFAEIRGCWFFNAIDSIHTTVHIVLKSIRILSLAWNLCSIALSCSFIVNCL